MPEKTADVRHYEHEGLLKNIDLLMERDEKRTETLTDFIISQSEANAEFREKFLGEIHNLERGISMKSENDNTIIATQNREIIRLNKVEEAAEETAKALAVVANTMENLANSMKKDLKEAHDAIRGQDTRIKKMEVKSGKLALKILSYVAFTGGGILLAWALGKILG
jgi:hypothetical protein